jgi:hypothetical protein
VSKFIGQKNLCLAHHCKKCQYKEFGAEGNIYRSHTEDIFDSLRDRKKRPSVFWDLQTFWENLSVFSSHLKLD